MEKINFVVIAENAPERENLVNKVKIHTLNPEIEIIFHKTPKTFLEGMGVEKYICERPDWAIWLLGPSVGSAKIQYIRIKDSLLVF